MNKKITYILEQKFNLFHADLISRSIFDESITIEQFIEGYNAICDSEKSTDDDEFIPDAFSNI